MIANIWKDIHVFCGCHEDPVELTPHTGSTDYVQGGKENSMFYSCPRYYPENREEGERACFNRLGIGEYEQMVTHISKKLEGDDDEYSAINLTGHKWKSKYGIEFRIIRHTRDHIDVSVVNRRATKIRI